MVTTVSNGAGEVVAVFREPHPNDALREAFPPESVGKLSRYIGPKDTPKFDRDRHTCEVCGKFHDFPAVHLDYVGHAEVTDRLLDVDPEWSWEPVAWDEDGLPRVVSRGGLAAMWIRLTVNGITRLGVGTAGADKADLEKELISDALRNAAMRFGVALGLWKKGDAEEGGEAAGPSTPAVVDRPCPACGRQVADNKAAHAAEDRKPAWRCTNRSCTGGSNDRPWASWDPDLVIPEWPEGAAMVVGERSVNALKARLVARLGSTQDAAQAWAEVMERYSLTPADAVPVRVLRDLEADLAAWEPVPDSAPHPFAKVEGFGAECRECGKAAGHPNHVETLPPGTVLDPDDAAEPLKVDDAGLARLIDSAEPVSYAPGEEPFV